MTTQLPKHSLTLEQVKLFRQVAGMAFDGQSVSSEIEWWDNWYDRIAGPKYALTEGERIVMALCRERFRFYEPTDEAQIQYILDLRNCREAFLDKVVA